MVAGYTNLDKSRGPLLLSGELPMAALCENYGISRKSGYKWLGR